VSVSKRLIVCASIALVLAGCGGDKGEKQYPRATRNAFLDACTSNGATQKQCQCALQKVERRVPYTEFRKQEAETAGGSLPMDRYTNDIVNCA
jgi:hypothetical protein